MKKLLLLLIIFSFFGEIVKAQINFGNSSNGTPSIGPNTIVNSYKKIQSVSGSTYTLINNTGFSLSAGNVVLVINMFTGEYELREVISVSGLTITLGAGSIPNANFTANSQMIIVPQYSSLTLNSGNSITCPEWDGSSGGVICFLVANTLTLNGGEIDAAGKGFFGGAGGNGGNGGAGGLGGYSGSNNSPNGGFTGYGGSGVGGAGWGGANGYPGINGVAGSPAFFSSTSSTLPCGNTIASCNNSPNPNSRLYMGDGGAGGSGGNGKAGAGGGGSKCNQPGINGGTGGFGGNGGNGGRGGGIIFIKAGNVVHTNTLIKAMGAAGSVGSPGTNGGNGGDGTCGGGGGDGADGGNGGGAGHGGAGGAVKIIKSSGSISANLVNVTGGVGANGGLGGPGGLGGLNSSNTTGVCACGSGFGCSLPLLIPFLSAPSTVVTVDLAGVTHFVFTYGDSILDLTYNDALFCNGYFMGVLSGTLFEAGAPIATYSAPIASLQNNILASLVDFVNNNPPNLDNSGQSILTLNYHLIEGCAACSQCQYQLSENGDPGDNGPSSTTGGNGYYDEACTAPVINNYGSSYFLSCPGQCTSIPISSSDPNASFQIVGAGGMSWLNGNNLIVCGNGMCGWAQIINVTATNQCGTSDPLTIIVETPYEYLTASPQSQTVCSGSPAPIMIFSNSPCGYSVDYSMSLPTGVTANMPSFGNIYPGMTFNPIFTNSTGIVQTVSIQFYTNCGGQLNMVQVIVNPTPVVNPVIDRTVCCQSSTGNINFSGTANSYAWTASTNPNITGYPTSGTGNIPSMTLINLNTTVQTITYTVTPSFGSCVGFSQTFTITVLPCASALTANTIANQSYCSGNSSNAIQIAGTATSYLWSTNNPSTGLSPSGIDVIPSFVANNSSNSPISSTITITPFYTSNGLSCTGNAQNFTITVYPASTTYNQTASNCDYYTWNGNTYTQSGIYQYQGTSALGCDSIVNLDLTIFKSFYDIQDVTSCGAYTWAVNNQTYTQSGTYNFQTFTTAGCDSTITLNLTVGNSTSGNEIVETCNSYTWNGNVYVNSGNYSATLLGSNGCDSIATLDLTILNLPNSPTVSISNDVNLSTSAQSNVSYQWVSCPGYLPISGATSNAYTVTSSGEYAVTVSNSCGADTSACLAVDMSNLNEMLPSEIKLYPNPTVDEVTIEVPEVLVGSNYYISDHAGRIILQGKVHSLKYNISMEEMACGSYYLTIAKDSKPIQIIKQ